MVRIAAVSVVLVAAAAFGQATGATNATPGAPSPAAPPTYQPNGIKIGDGRLHPFFDLEGRYDSAVGVFGNGQVAGDIALRFRPGLRFDLLNENHTVNFSGSGEYVLFTGLLSPAARDASRFQADVMLDTAFNKLGAVEFQIGDQLSRSDRTQNPALGVGVLSLFNNVRIAVPIHPGGRALEFTPKAAWAVELFEPLLGTPVGCAPTDPLCQAAQVSQLNYSNVNVGLGARWRFFPKTALVLDTNADFRTYFSGATTNRPATLFRAQAGLAGLITSKISVLATAGYGGEFLGTNAHTVIVQTEVGFLPSEGTSIRLGYTRNLAPVPIFGTYSDDRGYLDARALLFQRLSLGANLAFDYISFYTGNRADTILSTGANVGFAFTSWLSAALAYNLQLRASNSTTAGTSFTRHEVIARITLQY